MKFTVCATTHTDVFCQNELVLGQFCACMVLLTAFGESKGSEGHLVALLRGSQPSSTHNNADNVSSNNALQHGICRSILSFQTSILLLQPYAALRSQGMLGQ